MRLQINPEKVYVIGAAGYWLKKWPVSDGDRRRRRFQAFDRKFQKVIERERRRIARIEETLESLAN